MTVQPGLCRTWLETQIVCFLMHRLKSFSNQLSIAYLLQNTNITAAIMTTTNMTTMGATIAAVLSEPCQASGPFLGLSFSWLLSTFSERKHQQGHFQGCCLSTFSERKSTNRDY